MLFDSKWITYKTGEYKSADDKYGNPSPYFRKSFEQKGKAEKATLFAAALGVFKVYINGKPLQMITCLPDGLIIQKKYLLSVMILPKGLIKVGLTQSAQFSVTVGQLVISAQTIPSNVTVTVTELNLPPL